MKKQIAKSRKAPTAIAPKPAMPVRLKLSRKAGFNLQNESFKLNGLPCVKVSRPSKWGNPFKIGDDVPVITGALWVSASESFRSCRLADISETNTAPNFSGIGHGSCVFS